MVRAKIIRVFLRIRENFFSKKKLGHIFWLKVEWALYRHFDGVLLSRSFFYMNNFFCPIAVNYCVG